MVQDGFPYDLWENTLSNIYSDCTRLTEHTYNRDEY